LWPHLLDGDLVTPDMRTEHEGTEVVEGVKLGVNLHAHRSNLRTRVLAGCTVEQEAEAAEGAAGGAAVSHTLG
jgi:hypothetical protein